MTIGSFQHVVDCISREMTVSSIMTPWDKVDFAHGDTDTPQAKAEADAYIDNNYYSGVPLFESGLVHGVYLRLGLKENTVFHSAEESYFVPSNIGLFDLLGRLRNTGHMIAIVGSQNDPGGWVTYADFGKRPFRVLLFVLVAEVEYLLATALEVTHPNNSWVELIKEKKHRNKLEKEKERAEHWDVCLPLTTFANLEHLIIALGESPATIDLLGETASVIDKLDDIRKLRNRVDHVVKPVIAGPKCIAEVAGHVDLMLQWSQKWPTRLAAVTEGADGKH